MLRAFDRYRSEGTSACANPAPQLGRRGQAAKQFFYFIQSGDRVSQRRRDAAAAKKCKQPVLVLTTLYHSFPGQKNATGQAGTQTGDRRDIRLAVRNDEIDTLGPDNPAQSAPESALRCRRNEIIAVGGRFLEDESIVMAADDE
jgi:hypothetical protein